MTKRFDGLKASLRLGVLSFKLFAFFCFRRVSVAPTAFGVRAPSGVCVCVAGFWSLGGRSGRPLRVSFSPPLVCVAWSTPSEYARRFGGGGGNRLGDSFAFLRACFRDGGAWCFFFGCLGGFFVRGVAFSGFGGWVAVSPLCSREGASGLVGVYLAAPGAGRWSWFNRFASCQRRRGRGRRVVGVSATRPERLGALFFFCWGRGKVMQRR